MIALHGAEPERIKLLDFGLARISQLDPTNQQSLTVPGTVVGTFSYMSPEQVMGEEVDERGDIFALGVMIVEALTGSRPFLGRTSAELMAAIVGAPFRLAGEGAEVRQLESILQKCLAKDRRERFASVAAMQLEMIPAMERCPRFPSNSSSGIEMQSGDDATRTFLLP